jgi:TM2 domain-containing membrane protein YozV
MYQLWVAYLLWFVGGFGTFGLHRFYLKKVPTAVLWLLTGGGFLIGTIHDFLRMESLVREANWREGLGGPQSRANLDGPPTKKESLEKSILRAAKEHEGQLTTASAALSGDWNLEKVQKELDRQAKLGICELRITKAGGVVYYFAEFDPHREREFES